MNFLERLKHRLLAGVSKSYRPRGMILNYHRVGDVRFRRRGGPYLYTVTPDELSEQLAFLNERFDVVPLGQFIKRLRTPDSKEGMVAVTFDDGYRDTLTRALPVLERHDVPAAVFVCPGFLDGSTPPLQFVLFELLSRTSEITCDFEGRQFQLSTESSEETMEAYLTIKRMSESYDADRLRALVERLRTVNDVEVDFEEIFEGFMLDRSNLVSLAGHDLVTIGSHGYSHLHLTEVGDGSLDREVRQSRTALENLLDRPVELFAYPFGDRDSRVTRAVRDAGYRAAVTTGDRPVFPAHRNRPYQLPRIDERAGPERSFWSEQLWRQHGGENDG